MSAPALRFCALSLCALGSSAAGCGSEERAGTSAANEEPTLAIFDTRLTIGEPAPKEVGRAAVVELIDAGSEPRAALRYQMPEAAVQELIATGKTKQQIEVNGDPFATPEMPPVKAHLRIRSLTEGDAAPTYQIEIVSFEAIDYSRSWFAADHGHKTLEELEGYTFEIRASPTGVVTRDDVDAAFPEVEEEIRSLLLPSWSQVMSNLFTPLPDEPVGVGARWRVLQPPHDADFAIDYEQVYELERREGNRLHLRQSSAMSRSNSLMGTGPGEQMKLREVTMEGSGRRTLDLERIAPISEESSAAISMSMEVRDGKDTQLIDMNMAVESHMEAR